MTFPEQKIELPRLLIVENDTLVREGLCARLAGTFKVISAATAETALRLIGASDVMLLELCLPDGMGRIIAQEAGRAGVPIVWMTSDPVGARRPVLNASIILLKPFPIQQAIDALAKLSATRR